MNYKIISLIIYCLLIFTSPAFSQQVVQFYVSKAGNDENNGSKNAPFESLDQARDAIRHYRANHDMPAGGFQVLIEAGEYLLNASFDLEAQDSGYPKAPVVYRASDNGNVSLIGGKKLPGNIFTRLNDQQIRSRLQPEVGDKVVVADLRDLGITEFGELQQYGAPGYEDVVPAPELFFNNKPLTVARYPNEGFLEIAQAISKGSTRRWGDLGDDPMVFKYEKNRPSTWSNFEDIWMFGFWFSDWGFATNKIGAIDTTNKMITTAFPDYYGLRTDDRPIGGRYYFFNVLEELDAPGEWYLDRQTGKIYLYPPEPLEEAEIEISLLDRPFVQMTDVSNVHFDQLNFQLNRASGLVMEGGYHNKVSNCTFLKLGLHGIIVSGGQGHTVERTEIGLIGSAALQLQGGDRVILHPGNHLAKNNHIYNFGRIVQTYEPGIRLTGVGLTATHNEIHDAPHSAILFGGNEHNIAYNHIYRVCKISDDAGAIYGGRDWTSFGTAIEFNYLHDILGDKNRTHAIYLDDQLSGIKIHGNVIVNVTRPMLIGGGDYNQVTNNLIIGKTENSTADKGSIKLDQRGLNWQDVGPDHTLYENLRMVPYRAEPWKSRYPQLVNIISEGPKKPVGNVVKNNVILNHFPIMADDKVVELGAIESNLEKAMAELGEYGFEDPVSGDFHPQDFSKIKAELPDFEAIPFKKIGRQKSLSSPSLGANK